MYAKLVRHVLPLYVSMVLAFCRTPDPGAVGSCRAPEVTSTHSVRLLAKTCRCPDLDQPCHAGVRIGKVEFYPRWGNDTDLDDLDSNGDAGESGLGQTEKDGHSRSTAGQPPTAEMLTEWPARSVSAVNRHQLVEPARTGRQTLSSHSLQATATARYAQRRPVLGLEDRSKETGTRSFDRVLRSSLSGIGN